MLSLTKQKDIFNTYNPDPEKLMPSLGLSSFKIKLGKRKGQLFWGWIKMLLFFIGNHGYHILKAKEKRDNLACSHSFQMPVSGMAWGNDCTGLTHLCWQVEDMFFWEDLACFSKTTLNYILQLLQMHGHKGKLTCLKSRLVTPQKCCAHYEKLSITKEKLYSQGQRLNNSRKPEILHQAMTRKHLFFKITVIGTFHL